MADIWTPPEVSTWTPPEAQNQPSASISGPSLATITSAPAADWKSLYSGLDGPSQAIANHPVGQMVQDPRETAARNINQEFVKEQLGGSKGPAITDSNWEAIKSSYASTRFGTPSTKVLSDKELYGLISKDLGDLTKSESVMDAWSHPFVDLPEAKQFAAPTNDTDRTKQEWASIWNGIRPLVLGLETPLGVATLPAADELKAASTAYPAARVALASMSGVFSALMAHSTYKAAQERIALAEDPTATPQQKQTADVAIVAGTAATLLGALHAAETAAPGVLSQLKGKSISEAPDIIKDSVAKAEKISPEKEQAALEAAQQIQSISQSGPPEAPPEPPAAAPSAASGQPDYGIAARVSEDRARAGQIEAPEPGEGIAPATSVERGRQLLSEGANPDTILTEFNKTNRFSSDDLAVLRAKGEQLAQAASDAATKFGPNSEEYKVAAKADSDWIKAIKPVQTEWSKAGATQQGSTDIDTGDFHSLATAFKEMTGRDFTPDEANKAQRIADGVKDASHDAEEAKESVLKEIKKKTPSKGTPAEPGSTGDIWQRAQDLLEAGEGDFDNLRHKIAADTGLPVSEVTKKLAGPKRTRFISDDTYSKMAQRRQLIKESVMKEIKKKTPSKGTPAEPGSTGDIWQRAQDLLEAGEDDFDDLRHKIAADTGLPVSEVTKKLTGPKRIRVISDDMYYKMAQRRQRIRQANHWLKQQAMPGWQRFATAIPRAFFGDKVFGHGTVGMITHAGINMFDPTEWGMYWPEFFKQYKLIGWHDQGAFHERAMQDLVRDKKFMTARRAGLANDPNVAMDDYQKGFLGKIGLTGNRGFDALKIYRQARFNQTWDRLTPEMRTPEMAKLVADDVNHSTGYVRAGFPQAVRTAFFAPKLEGSRWAFLIGDTARNARIFASWETTTPEEKAIALADTKRKAIIAGTYLTLLAANQGLLEATHSKEKINFSDPRKPDFLAFKVAGHQVGIVSPTIGLFRYLTSMVHASLEKRSGAELKGSRAEEMGTLTTKYLRAKLSPFGQVVADVASQADYSGRPLPFSADNVPSYLKRRGVGPYSYSEYVAQQIAPIPIEDAIKEVWSNQGMSHKRIDDWMSAFATFAIVGGTGAGFEKDRGLEDQQSTPAREKKTKRNPNISYR